jgi:hypothetical protein
MTPAPAFEIRLAVAAVAYNLWHHLGSLPGGLGAVGDTRRVDWVDLLTPFAVLLPAAWALAAVATGGRRWVVLAVGALLYAQGQGIHLAANSIGNVAPSPVVHLWDEVVGHAVWYGGVAVVLGVLAVAAAERPWPGRRGAAVAVALALVTGTTWVTNALGGGGLAVPGLLVAAALAGFGWRHRDDLAAVFAIGFGPAAAALAATLAARAG